ncbi:MAG: 4a-hydroxytetrahydrobiopterin dehydratase [Roseiarcus sp.]|jgi:4a-hydroxytetrahydrobiopterin dehydratase
MANTVILSESELQSALQKLRDWSVKGPNIEASFEFKTFRDAISFIVQIAIEAEVVNHHPELHNSYNRVSFSLCTHDAGNRITDLDIKMAARIGDAAHRFRSMT